MPRFVQLSLFLLFLFFAVLYGENSQNMSLLGTFPVGECLSVSSQGDFAAISSGFGVRMMDISNPHQPRHRSSVRTPGKVSQIKWVGDYLYVSLEGTGSWAPPGTAGLVIIDVSDIDHPQLITYHDTNSKCQTLEVKDNMVFLGTSNNLLTFDVTDPYNPQQIQSVYVSAAQSMEIHGNLLYMASTNFGIKIFDISNLQAIQQIGAYTAYHSSQLHVWGQHLFYYPNVNIGVIVFDVSDPTTPVIVDTLELPQNETCEAVADDGTYLYLASYAPAPAPNYQDYIFHLRKMDISDLANPVTVSSYTDTDYQTHYSRIRFAASDRMLIATGNGLRIVNPNYTPTMSLDSYYPTHYDLKEIWRQGHHLYGHYENMNGVLGLIILDIQEIAYPREKGYLILSHHTGTPSRSALQGQYFFVSHDTTNTDTLSSRGITIINVSDPSNPYEEQTLRFRHPISAMSVSSTHLYTAYADTIFTLDLSTFSWVGALSLGPLKDPYVLSVQQDKLFSGGNKSIFIMDISNGVPSVMGSYTMMSPFYSVRNFDRQNDILFVTCSGDSGLFLLDISDPMFPQKIAAAKYGSAWDVEANGNYAYVANNYLGVRMLDISNLSDIQEVGYYNMENNWATRLAEYGQFICVLYNDIYIMENNFVSSVKDEKPPLIDKFQLYQNYPNPFNPETRITYRLPERGEVRLEIYNTLGQKVRTLVRGMQETGTHTVVWDGRDEAGQLVASGVYLYQLQAGKYRQTRKMVLMK